MGLPRFFKLNTTSKSERSSSTVQLDLPSPKFAGQQPYTAVTPISPASSYSHEDYFPSTETQNHSFSWSSSSSTSQKSSTASICDKVGLNKGLRVSEGITSYRQTLRVLAYVDARPVVKIDEETATPNPITKEPFYIELDAGADVEATAAEVERALGVSGKFSAGCYKVSIPKQALQQAAAYTQLYGQKVDLITHFPAWSLNDPKQLHAALGDYSHASGRDDPRSSDPVMVKDCWRKELRYEEDEEKISLVIRLGELEPSGRPPLTALVYFSRPIEKMIQALSPASPSLHTPSGSIHKRTPVPEAVTPEPPVATEIPSGCTVNELKRIMLKTDGRPVGALEKCTVWSVDMTWEEMRSCEAFGGLRDKGMPWPYPPTSAPPLKLANGNELVATYLPNMISNVNLVSFYIHIDQSITGLLANNKTAQGALADEAIPNFHYPMDLPPPTKTSPLLRRNSFCRNQTAPPAPLSPVVEQRATSRPPARRVRPSTAPVGNGGGQSGLAPPHIFGSRSTLIRAKSKLSVLTPDPKVVAPATAIGLGIVG